MRAPLLIALLVVFAGISSSAPPPAPDLDTDLEWDARAVEHLLNRAGFGARPDEIARWVEAGPEATIEALFDAGSWTEPPVVRVLAPDKRRLRELPVDERRAAINAARRADRAQERAYLVGWLQEMLRGEAPLRNRMTLFWHGVFTSQTSKVQASHEMIGQNLLLRDHALGNYGALLRAILRDPAMLVYLDNDESEAERPNENLARELLELFSLGEGNYTEVDVRETARALTGHGVDRRRGYVFDPEQHDGGAKAILGISGPLDLDDVVDAILEEPACARYVVARLIAYLEGVAPGPDRLERYAALLRDADHELEPVLRALFLDPEFYRPEIVGARVLSPVDYLVGSARRLGVEPPAAAVLTGAEILGEQLFEPPNVKGWEGGHSWITTSTLIHRGNLAGMWLGLVGPTELSAEDPLIERLAAARLSEAEERELDHMLSEDSDGESMETMETMEPEGEEGGRAEARSPLVRVARVLDTAGYAPRINLTARLAAHGAAKDGEIVAALLDELLAIEPPRETKRRLVRELRSLRERARIGRGELLDAGVRAERILRRLAHLVLSLPEAQLG